MRMNYKGYEISITKHYGGTNGVQYLAKALNGSDYAFGDSEDDAISALKRKIDAIPGFQSIYMRPYEKDKLDRFITVMKEPRTLTKLRMRFDRQHYIKQDFCTIDARAIINHFAIIEQILNEDGNSYKLDWLKISPHDGREYYILFDKKYFDKEMKIRSLIDRLEN